MPRRIWFGDDYWDFNDDAAQDEIDAIGKDWMRFGSLDAVRQKFAIEGLSSDPGFLALPFMERQAAFNSYAKDGPYWGILKSDERRAIRDLVVNTEGANEAETYNYWQAPFTYGGDNILDKMSVFEEEHQNLLGSAVGTVADMGKMVQTGTNDLLANLWAGVTTQLSVAAKGGLSEEQMRELGEGPLQNFEKLRGYTKDLAPNTGKWLDRAAGELAEDARRVQMDASIGRDLVAGPTKYESFEEAREEGGFGGYLRHGITTAAGQAPQVGTNVALALIPVIGPALSTEAMMAMETGGALDQMAQDGVDMGMDAEEAAVAAGTINGILERVPIGALLNRIPGFKQGFKKAIWKHTAEVLKQGGLEAVTEFPQNIVTDAAIELVNERRGELDKVRWRTPEGRAESVGEAWEAAQAGAFTGTIMALFGLGAGQMQRRVEGEAPTGEKMAEEAKAAEEAAQPSPDLQAAREILRRLQGDQGPAVPEMGGMEPTYPGQGPPADAVPGVVAPPGSVDAAGDTLPLVGGPGGATTWEQGQWSEADEQKARFNYAPEWMLESAELTDAFARGDIDEDTLAEMEALGMAAGLDPMQARADILERRDQAITFLRGDMMQEETGDFGVLETEDMGEFAPSQRGQRTLVEGMGVGPAATGAEPVSPEPGAPTQPRGVEGGPMRLGEGQQVEPEVEAAWREGGAETTAVTPPVGERETISVEVPGAPGTEVIKNPTDADIDQFGKEYSQFLRENGVSPAEELAAVGRENFGVRYVFDEQGNKYVWRGWKGDHEVGLKHLAEKIGAKLSPIDPTVGKGEPGEGAPGAPTAPAAPPTTPAAPAVPPTREETGRRAAPRGREVDAVVSRMFELQRSGQFNPELVGRLITRIQAGDDVMALFQEDAELSEGLHGEIVETALDLEEAVATRQREDKVARELEAEAMGEEAVVVDEGPPPEATGAELEALVKGEGEVEAGIKPEAEPTGEVVIDEPKKANFDKRAASRGNVETVVTPDGSMQEEVEYVLIEAEHLTASHDAKMAPNPAYPDALQPRDRTRVASEEQVSKIANNLDPARLGDARVSSSGAPIVGADGVVESGNARTIALQRVYAKKTKEAAAYKRWLIDNAERLGLDKTKLMQMGAPVMVRVRKSGENRVEFAQKSNEAEVARMSAAETARSDASKITDEMLSAFDVGEDGDVLATSNREFVRLFLDTLSDTERAALADAEGNLSVDGIKRIQNAVLTKAYGDGGGVVENLIESPDSNIKRIGSAMLSAAPKVIEFQSNVKQGVNDPAHDLVPALMEAVQRIAKLRHEGRTVEQELSQTKMFGEDMTTNGRQLLEHLASKKLKNSAKATAEFIKNYYDGAIKQTITEAQPGLDLGLDAVTQEWLIDQAIKGPQETMFDLSKPTPVKPVQVGDMRKGFPGWTVRKVTPTVYRLTRKGQPIVHVALVSRAPTEAELKRAAKVHDIPLEEVKAAIAAGELAVKGSYMMNEITGAHLVTLFSPEAGPASVFEEAFHFAFHNILNASQRQLLLKAHKTEEGASAAYKKFASKGAVQKVFDAIKNFAKSLLGMNNVDVDAALSLMKKIASGKIYTQDGRYFTKTDPSGAIPFKVFENTILNAEEAAKEKGKLKASEFGQAVDDTAQELGHSQVFRGDNAMFSLEAPADVPLGHHPAQILPETTEDERIREKAKKIIYDKLGPILTIQEKLTGIGESVNSMFNAYQKAVNFQSRAGALLDWVNDNLFTPFLDEVAASGIKLPDFDRFRMSAHALERNLKLYGTHVTIPIQIAEAKIKSLKKKMITTGAKVRDLKFGNKGTVKKVFKDSGRAEVEFVNPKNPYARKIVSVEMKNIELESLARAKDDIAEIRRMEAAGEVPHSGVSNEDARATLEEMKALGLVSWTGDLGPTTDYTGPMGALSKKFSAIVRWKEQTLYKAGLLSKEELALWREYKHYSPMRGKDPDILDVINGGRRTAIPDIEAYGGSMWNRVLHRVSKGLGIEGEIFSSGAGRGFNPGRGAASHRALGRRSFPKHSPTAELMTDAMQAAVRAERNRVGKVVWNLVNKLRDVRDVKGEKLFEIDTPDTRLVFDEKTGTVKSRVDGLSVMKDNVYSVWIDGKLHYIRHVSPDMAEFVSALNNLGNNKDLHVVLKGSAAINRYISKMATSLNPGFTIPNAFRDAITSGIKLLGEEKYKDFGLKTMTRAPEAWATLSEYARLQSKGRLDEMDAADRKRVEAFKLAGGETAFWMIPDLELQMKRLQNTLRKAKGDENVVLGGAKSVISFIEDYNAAVENTMRFSVFERGIEIGLSPDQAAVLARDITVDFTKQGTAARSLGGMWVFANAGIQGSANMFKAVAKNKPVQRIVMAGVGYAFMHATMMRYMGGEDPEDGIAYWDKVPWYEKSRNLIFMIPGTKGKRIRIPLPWGYNVFTAIGFAAADVVSGPKTAWEGTMNVLSTAMSAFNPIGDNDLTTLSGWVQMAMPSPLDPIMDIALNKNFWGGPIKPEESKYKKSEQYGEASPNYNRYFSSVSKPSKAVARLLYKYGGLGIFEHGPDVSPEDLDYGIAAVFGGLGDTVNRAASVIVKKSQRESLVARDVPILKSFYGDESQFFAPQMYRENMADYWLKKEQYDYLKKEDPKSANEFYKRHREILGYESMVKATEKRIRGMKKNGVRVTDSRMQREFKQFNRRFNTLETRTMKRWISERK